MYSLLDYISNSFIQAAYVDQFINTIEQQTTNSNFKTDPAK